MSWKPRGGARDLSQLNELFGAWLEGVYHRTRHSEINQTPPERRLAGRQLRRPTPAELHQAFLWAEKRRVTKTASVSLFGNDDEVDAALVGVWATGCYGNLRTLPWAATQTVFRPLGFWAFSAGLVFKTTPTVSKTLENGGKSSGKFAKTVRV